MNVWIVQIKVCDPLARWTAYRHRDGSKDVAHFGTLGALRRFVKHHCLSLGQGCRAYNEVTKEYVKL